eukprot:1006217-Prorocentrum_minimum.AAC.2
MPCAEWYTSVDSRRESRTLGRRPPEASRAASAPMSTNRRGGRGGREVGLWEKVGNWTRR